MSRKIYIIRSNISSSLFVCGADVLVGVSVPDYDNIAFIGYFISEPKEKKLQHFFAIYAVLLIQTYMFFKILGHWDRESPIQKRPPKI